LTSTFFHTHALDRLLLERFGARPVGAVRAPATVAGALHLPSSSRSASRIVKISPKWEILQGRTIVWGREKRLI
jgi:hypothetical protein